METIMEKKNIDWGNLGFSYIQTDKRYVSNYKDGAWDEGTLTAMLPFRFPSVPVFCSMHRLYSKA